MRLTVLGSSASYAGPGQACSGYLVEHGENSLLMDCGNGVVSNLGQVADPLSLDAVLLTHGHPDHVADIYALQALLRYAPEGPREPLDLWVPAGVFERLGALLSERGRAELAEAFVVHELVENETLMVGEIAVTPVRVEHSEETFGLVIETEDGKRMGYTSDTKPCHSALRVAASVNLLLAEATLPERYRGHAPHLTTMEASGLAREAGATRLVLTHVWPTNDREEMLEIATNTYGRGVTVAREFDAFDI